MPHASTCFQEIQDKVISPEKAEEAKLKARYPNLGNKPGGSDLLRKRLQKGVSYLLRLFAKYSEFTKGQSDTVISILHLHSVASLLGTQTNAVWQINITSRSAC